MIATFISLFVLYREAKKIDLQDLQDKTLKNETGPLITEDAEGLTNFLDIFRKSEERHQENLKLLYLKLEVTKQKNDLLEKFPVLYGTFDKNESHMSMLYEEKRILDKILKDLENRQKYIANFLEQSAKKPDDYWKNSIEDYREILKSSFRDVGNKYGRILENEGVINSQVDQIDIATQLAPIVEACETGTVVANIPIMDTKSIEITSHNIKEGDQTMDDLLADMLELFFITLSYLGKYSKDIKRKDTIFFYSLYIHIKISSISQ